MNKPRILMFGWEFPPYNSGGLGVACLGLTRALARAGSEVIFVLPKSVPLSAEYMQILFADTRSKVTMKNIDTILSPYMTEHSYMYERTRIQDRQYGNNLYEEVLRYAQNAKHIAMEEDYDLIYAHDWLSLLAGIAAHDVSGKPMVAHIHATEYDRCGGDNVNPVIAAIEQRGLEAADRIVAVSNYTKEVIVQKYGIDADKIDVVHNGIDAEDFPDATAHTQQLQKLKARGTKIVLFVGRLTVQKGLEYFITAAKKVLEYKENVVFVIAGSGDMQQQVIAQAAALGIADKVLFMGFVRGKELQEAYKMADLYVMPSVSEPFGLTTLESMLHGTPVLVSRQSGVAEVATNTLKVDFWDTEEMANKILAVISYDALQYTLATEGAREVERLNWAAAARKCLYVFKQLPS